MNVSSNLFVDTSGWAELSDPRLQFHQLASRIYAQATANKYHLLTTNYILSELIALLHSPLRFARSRTIEVIEGIKNSPYIEIVHIDPILDDAAWQLLKSRTDKNWSLADAASFIVMREKGLTDAITTDHHFEQSGFVRLLK